MAGDESCIYDCDPEAKEQSFQWNSPNWLRPRKRVRWRAKTRVCSLFTRDSFWQAKQSILHTAVTFCGNWKSEDFVLNFDDQRISCCIMMMCHFKPRNFLPKPTWLSPPTHFTRLIWPHDFFLFPLVMIPLLWHKWSDRGRIVVRADTLTKHESLRMRLKSGRSDGNGEYARKGTTLRVMVATRPKISFWPDGNTSPENYGLIWYYYSFCTKLVGSGIVIHTICISFTEVIRLRTKGHRICFVCLRLFFICWYHININHNALCLVHAGTHYTWRKIHVYNATCILFATCWKVVCLFSDFLDVRLYFVQFRVCVHRVNPRSEVLKVAQSPEHLQNVRYRTISLDVIFKHSPVLIDNLVFVFILINAVV
jgi:hypothetical protein